MSTNTNQNGSTAGVSTPLVSNTSGKTIGGGGAPGAATLSLAPSSKQQPASISLRGNNVSPPPSARTRVNSHSSGSQSATTCTENHNATAGAAVNVLQQEHVNGHASVVLHPAPPVQMVRPMGLAQKFPSTEMLSDEDNEQQQQCQNNGPTATETGVNVLVPNTDTNLNNAAVVVPVYTTTAHHHLPCLSNVNVNVVRGRHASYDFDPLYCPASDAVAAGTISSDAEDALTPRMPLQQQQQMMVDQSQATSSSLPHSMHVNVPMHHGQQVVQQHNGLSNHVMVPHPHHGHTLTHVNGVPVVMQQQPQGSAVMSSYSQQSIPIQVVPIVPTSSSTSTSSAVAPVVASSSSATSQPPELMDPFDAIARRQVQ